MFMLSTGKRFCHRTISYLCTFLHSNEVMLMHFMIASRGIVSQRFYTQCAERTCSCILWLRGGNRPPSMSLYTIYLLALFEWITGLGIVG